MTDPVGPGNLVRHMQNRSYAYDGLSLSYASVYAIALWTLFDRNKSQDSKRISLAGLLLYMYLPATRNTRRCEQSAVWPNVTQHVFVSTVISRLLDTCLSGIHNANYIINSIVCAVILVCAIRIPAYGIRPTHGPIHVLDMHGTGTKHIVCHSQKSVKQWSGVSEFTCI